MYSFLSQDGSVGLHLPREERESFLVKYKTEQSVQYGAVIKEYVVVPNDLLGQTSEYRIILRSVLSTLRL